MITTEWVEANGKRQRVIMHPAVGLLWVLCDGKLPKSKFIFRLFQLILVATNSRIETEDIPQPPKECQCGCEFPENSNRWE